RRRDDRAVATPVTLPANAKQAADSAKACFRSWGSHLQYGQVIRWLREQGIDCSLGSFDQAKFKTWFEKKFGERFLSPTDKRRKAVKDTLQKLGEPGRGGENWQIFHRGVEQRCGQSWTLRTIKRDVAELLGK